MKKVFIGTPIHQKKQYCLNTFFQCALSLDYDSFKILAVDNSTNEQFIQTMKQQYTNEHIEFYHIHFDTDSKDGDLMHKRLVASYNYMRERFLQSDYDLFMTLECDVMIQHDGLKKLVDANKEMIQGLYYPGFFNELEHGEGIVKIPDHRGLNGISLFTRRVIEKIEFRYDQNNLTGLQDAFFFTDAYNLKFESWLHKDVKAMHVPGWK